MISPPDGVYEAVARASADLCGFHSAKNVERMTARIMAGAEFRAAVDSAYAAGVAAGRAQAAADIRAADVERIERLHGDTVRLGLTVAARIAEGR